MKNTLPFPTVSICNKKYDFGGRFPTVPNGFYVLHQLLFYGEHGSSASNICQAVKASLPLFFSEAECTVDIIGTPKLCIKPYADIESKFNIINLNSIRKQFSWPHCQFLSELLGLSPLYD